MSYRGVNSNGRGGEEEKGLIWKLLPVVKSKHLGKLGPGFGIGGGCGFGLGIGFIGGVGFGAGLPGLQLGFGLGGGCGVGLGFGYGAGRGVAYDHHTSRSYSNIPKVRSTFPPQNEIGTLIDELVFNTKKLIEATSREVDKWRRD